MTTEKKPEKPGMTDQQATGCLILLFIGVVVVALLLRHKWAEDERGECEARTCPEERVARLIGDQCLCVIVPRTEETRR